MEDLNMKRLINGKMSYDVLKGREWTKNRNRTANHLATKKQIKKNTIQDTSYISNCMGFV